MSLISYLRRLIWQNVVTHPISVDEVRLAMFRRLKDLTLEIISSISLLSPTIVVLSLRCNSPSSWFV